MSLLHWRRSLFAEPSWMIHHGQTRKELQLWHLQNTPGKIGILLCKGGVIVHWIALNWLQLGLYHFPSHTEFDSISMYQLTRNQRNCYIRPGHISHAFDSSPSIRDLHTMWGRWSSMFPFSLIPTAARSRRLGFRSGNQHVYCSC